MNVFVSALVAAATGFVTGWYGRDWWLRSNAHAKVVEVIKPKFTPYGIAYFVMFAVIVGTIVYGNFNTDSKVSASEARQNDRNTAQIGCLSETFEEFLTGNQELRTANKVWGDALVASKEAASQLVLVRDIRGLPRESQEVQDAAQAYRDSVGAFKAANTALNDARRRYQLPDFKQRCGSQPGFKNSWYSPAGFDGVYQYPMGLSFDAQ